MKHPLFIFKARNGKPDFANQSEILFRQHLSEHDGKTYEIWLRESKRSGSQNRFYWLYLEVIEHDTGNNAETLHEYFRRKLLAPVFKKVMIDDEWVEVKLPRSTTDLSKTEMSDYMDKISALVEIAIPNPEDAGFIK